ncbi:undecaprenyldiphospho-muramoylpentapeptide beta-N-acetylglucosaminyltransferase [Candidatus Profftia sp. (ex Adelges kitamiensis)]|uniref:undecaprenyldiphospho-muramoylpentapeptide beta-N-acetylglucosaminyltransferase n=1 Tax=Candidatus Profftia sp. (ex Adelges kitamiensis) TaxID=2864218 RepID=UPI001CE31CE0|nr:undecaprenyldiphospho-muramoylpentapeptide beta-N-acetylglucosaminyltransferase [Candidatus Profftia sp. (ex Adelges kitamiensis)]
MSSGDTNFQKSKRLMIVAGGTGGHIFPGLTVARYLQVQGWHVRWLGADDRMESYLVPKYNIAIDFIRILGFCGKSVKYKLAALMFILRAVLQAKTIIQIYQPDVVLGMGGYVSGPGILAAWICGIPVVLHEQNSTAGLTNRLLAKIATRTLQAFSGALSNDPGIGNPVRADVISLPHPQQRLAGRIGPIRILVLGGSQGADILNYIMPKVARNLGNKVSLWHQVGKGSLPAVLADYNKVGQTQHRLIEFIDDISSAYYWADVVVCRSGALTVSEISAAGLPALFIPFMHKDRQQYWNALPLEKAGAAKIIEQPRLTVELITDTLVLWDRQTLLEMAKKARSFAIINATECIASVICEVVK